MEEVQDIQNGFYSRNLNFRRDKTFVRVIGNLRSFNEQRSLVGVKVRAIEDFNEVSGIPTLDT
jgi:hypothetical protein